MLETGIEMRLKTQFENDVVMVAVDVGIYPIEAFEHLSDEGGECFGEGDAWTFEISTHTHTHTHDYIY
jgi:hypothetical protein